MSGLGGWLFGGEGRAKTAACVQSGSARAPACIDGIASPLGWVALYSFICRWSLFNSSCMTSTAHRRSMIARPWSQQQWGWVTGAVFIRAVSQMVRQWWHRYTCSGVWCRVWESAWAVKQPRRHLPHTRPVVPWGGDAGELTLARYGCTQGRSCERESNKDFDGRELPGMSLMGPVAWSGVRGEWLSFWCLVGDEAFTTTLTAVDNKKLMDPFFDNTLMGNAISYPHIKSKSFTRSRANESPPFTPRLCFNLY